MPADAPDLLVASMIYHYPAWFADRTSVLEYLFLAVGNDFSWDGQGRLVADTPETEPSTPADPLESFVPELSDPVPLPTRMRERRMAAATERLSQLHRIRHAAADLARTTGPVRIAPTAPLYPQQYTHMANAPANITAAWRDVLDEARTLFSRAWMMQKDAVAHRYATLSQDRVHNACVRAYTAVERGFISGRVSAAELDAVRAALARHHPDPIDVDDARRERNAERSQVADRHELWHALGADLDAGRADDEDSDTLGEGTSSDPAAPRSPREVVVAEIDWQIVRCTIPPAAPAPNLLGVDWQWARTAVCELLAS